MYEYKTIHQLEWYEYEDCIRVVDTNDEDVHVFWNDDLENLRTNPNFRNNLNVVAYMLEEFDHGGGDIMQAKYSTYDRELEHILDILRLRDPFLAAMSRKRQSRITDDFTVLYNSNQMEHCVDDFIDINSDFIEEQSCKSILIRYLEIAIANHSTYSRLEIDFYIDELDSIEEALFASETDTLEE